MVPWNFTIKPKFSKHPYKSPGFPNFTSKLFKKIYQCLVPELFEVTALRDVEAGVGPQIIQSIDQWTVASGSTNSDAEVLDTPVDGADVNVWLKDSEFWKKFDRSD